MVHRCRLRQHHERARRPVQVHRPDWPRSSSTHRAMSATSPRNIHNANCLPVLKFPFPSFASIGERSGRPADFARNAHVQSAAAQDVDRGSWQGPPLDCNIWFVGTVRPRPVCPWATIAPPADGHLTASLGGRQSFSWSAGLPQRSQDRGGRFLSSGATVVRYRFGSGGQKDGGQKNGDQLRERREPSYLFVVPGFCLFSSGFWSSGLFSGPGFRRRTNKLSSRGRSGAYESRKANMRPRSAAASGSAVGRGRAQPLQRRPMV